jgi:hypothetical protein
MSNYTYHGTRDLIALPGRSVQTFPSGLVRVDRTYACRAADAGRFRQQFAVGNPLPFDDGAPAIDQMSIFPEPQEERGEDGFVRFRVSAYGRVNTTGTVQSFFEEGRFTVNSFSALPPTTTFNTFQDLCVNEVAIVSFVAPNTNEPLDNLPRDIPLRVFVRQNGTLVPIESVYRPGTVFTESGGSLGRIQTNTRVTINSIIEDSPGTVFGAWKEVVYKLRANATVNRDSSQANN